MTQRTETLKPCPFCAGSQISLKRSVTDKDARYIVRCNNQNCPMNAGSCPIPGGKKAAIDAWNTRAEPEPSVTGDNADNLLLQLGQRGDLIYDLEVALKLAAEALKYSEPKMKHYPEPIERHQSAIKAVADALNHPLSQPLPNALQSGKPVTVTDAEIKPIDK